MQPNSETGSMKKITMRTCLDLSYSTCNHSKVRLILFEPWVMAFPNENVGGSQCLVFFQMPPYDQCVLFCTSILTSYLEINLSYNYLLYDFKVKLILKNYTMASYDYTRLSFTFDWCKTNTSRWNIWKFVTPCQIIKSSIVYPVSDQKWRTRFTSKFSQDNKCMWGNSSVLAAPLKYLKYS